MNQNENQEQEIEVIEMPYEEIYGNVAPYTGEGCALLRRWLKQNGVTYYARPKEDFYKSEAYRQARVDGNTKLILDNLS